MLGLGFGLVWLGIRCSLSILELMPGAIWCETLLEHYVHIYLRYFIPRYY